MAFSDIVSNLDLLPLILKMGLQRDEMWCLYTTKLASQGNNDIVQGSNSVLNQLVKNLQYDFPDATKDQKINNKLVETFNSFGLQNI